jgi:cell division protein FtsW
MSKRKIQSYEFDGALLGVVVILLVYGFLSLYSATFYVGDALWHKQLLWIGISVVAGYAMFKIPYPVWQKLALLMMAVNLLALVVTLLFAKPSLGATRGLLDLSVTARDLGSLFGKGSSIQPGVTARLVAVIYIAAWLASKGDQLNKVKYGLFPFGTIVGSVAGLVVLQPDMSTALLIVVTGVAMFFFAGGDPIQIFLSLFFGGGTIGVLVWKWPHAKDRLEPFFQSFTDPAALDDHIRRSLQTISQGGIFGEGLGQGRMKFGYLPVPWTDSVFAVVAEEGGLIACLLVLALFAVFAYRGYRVSLSTPDAFGSLVVFGVTTMVLTEALMNILVMTGLFPPTGTALPFFSYGGTQMLMTLAGVGLMLGVSRGRPKGDWNAALDRWWRDRRARVSRSGRRAGIARHRA